MIAGDAAPQAQGYSLPAGQQRLIAPGELPTAPLVDDADKKLDPFAELPQWAARQSRGGSGAFFLKSEKRDWTNMGRGGGFYERQDVTRNDYNSDDEEVDEFGRKKKRKIGKAKAGAKPATKDEKTPKDETRELRVEESTAAAYSTALSSSAFAPPERDGDWMCPLCGDMQFGRNLKCRMCGTDRPGGAGKSSAIGSPSASKGAALRADIVGKGPPSHAEGLTEDLRWAMAQAKGCKGALLQAKGAPSYGLTKGGAPNAQWNLDSGWGAPAVGFPGKGAKGMVGVSQESLSRWPTLLQHASMGGLNGVGW